MSSVAPPTPGPPRGPWRRAIAVKTAVIGLVVYLDAVAGLMSDGLNVWDRLVPPSSRTPTTSAPAVPTPGGATPGPVSYVVACGVTSAGPVAVAAADRPQRAGPTGNACSTTKPHARLSRSATSQGGFLVDERVEAFASGRVGPAPWAAGLARSWCCRCRPAPGGSVGTPASTTGAVGHPHPDRRRRTRRRLAAMHSVGLHPVAESPKGSFVLNTTVTPSSTAPLAVPVEPRQRLRIRHRRPPRGRCRFGSPQRVRDRCSGSGTAYRGLRTQPIALDLPGGRSSGSSLTVDHRRGAA